MNKTVNILGTEYKIIYKDSKDDSILDDKQAYTNFLTKEIVMRTNLDELTESEQAIRDKRTLRHEILHAYLYESGLDLESSWAREEEMIDFFAIQFEKIHKTYKNIGALENKERCIY